jgi:hypothetical protein
MPIDQDSRNHIKSTNWSTQFFSDRSDKAGMFTRSHICLDGVKSNPWNHWGLREGSNLRPSVLRSLVMRQCGFLSSWSGCSWVGRSGPSGSGDRGEVARYDVLSMCDFRRSDRIRLGTSYCCSHVVERDGIPDVVRGVAIHISSLKSMTNTPAEHHQETHDSDEGDVFGTT